MRTSANPALDEIMESNIYCETFPESRGVDLLELIIEISHQSVGVGGLVARLNAVRFREAVSPAVLSTEIRKY
tara:strand:- start:45 stop:263 length:219 start_codon:yes stop_codon:yes gene_type:complete